MKAVVDTSVFVSYLLSRRGVGAWLLYLWGERHFDIVISAPMHAELLEVLERPHIAPQLDQDRKLTLLRRLRQDAVWTPGTLDASGAMPDPDDDHLVSAALETKAEFIVTLDKSLLEQDSYEGVRIVTPDQFVSIVVRK